MTLFVWFPIVALFEDINTISIRATKITSVSGLCDSFLNISSTEFDDGILQQRHSLYPTLKFTCNTNLTRWWFIGNNTRSVRPIRFTSASTIDRPSLNIWTPNGSGQYTLRSSIPADQISTMSRNPTLTVNQPVNPVAVHVNDVISITKAEPTLNNIRHVLLYQCVGGPTGHFGAAGMMEDALTFSFALATNRSDYPIVAVETGSNYSHHSNLLFPMNIFFLP